MKIARKQISPGIEKMLLRRTVLLYKLESKNRIKGGDMGALHKTHWQWIRGRRKQSREISGIG